MGLLNSDRGGHRRLCELSAPGPGTVQSSTTRAPDGGRALLEVGFKTAPSLLPGPGFGPTHHRTISETLTPSPPKRQQTGNRKQRRRCWLRDGLRPQKRVLEGVVVRCVSDDIERRRIGPDIACN